MKRIGNRQEAGYRIDHIVFRFLAVCMYLIDLEIFGDANPGAGAASGGGAVDERASECHLSGDGTPRHADRCPNLMSFSKGWGPRGAPGRGVAGGS